MIPSVLAHQVRRGVEDFLRTTFPVATPFFHGIIDRLLAEEGGLFKGPYLSLALPFRQGAGAPPFPDLALPFAPYRHQEEAFTRLGGEEPRSTLVATGTGSGKTECFLYPILDHCRRHAGEPGIKAILIYPMNALAHDQAERLARLIWSQPTLKGRVTAGLFVGQREVESRRVMGPEAIITDKESQRLTPPDILLTNYKMLDYLLVRPRDFPLWKQNGPETLRFLVVDELHTFDGAQGTDLACLVRRLKARLGTPEGHLCCVGTSATMGSESDHGELVEYAGKVFGEPFAPDAVITESRLSAAEFLAGSGVEGGAVVGADRIAELDPDGYDTYPTYVRGQHLLWFGEAIPEEEFESPEWRVRLGERLRGLALFQNLLRLLGGGVMAYGVLLEELVKLHPELREGNRIYRDLLLDSLLALVSEARVWREEDKEHRARRETEGRPRPTAPFLQVRLQLWLRELRRMVAEVGRKPRLRFADDLTEEQLQIHLPAVHCRDCGSVGWAGLRGERDSSVRCELQDFYVQFFKPDPSVVYLFPAEQEDEAQRLDGEAGKLCPTCLNLSHHPEAERCPACGEEGQIAVVVPKNRKRGKNGIKGSRDCPYCGAREGLSLVGSQAASLTSVIIGQLQASGYNDDKKLLTFSDSVQDAAHRAGFFAARTYRFNLRSALQQFVQEEGEGLTLETLPAAFTDHWAGRLGELNYVTTFLAPDMAWLEEYERLREEGELPEGSELRGNVDRRVAWEIFSEYGFRARIGRTLEKTSSSAAHLDPERLEGAVSRLLEPLRNEIGELRDLDPLTLRRFLLGLVVHLKNQGAVVQQVLDDYIESGGDTWKLNNPPWTPRFGPNTRAPSFLTSRGSSKSRFERLLSGSATHRTWYQGWAEKCFLHVSPFVGAATDHLYDWVLKGLVGAGVLEERSVRGDRVWGLHPASLRVTTAVIQLRCRRCGHDTSAAELEQSDWEGAPCLRFHCAGSYGIEPPRPDYYGKLYATGDISRLFAEEHTGLLSRDERERVEGQFKAEAEERRPWYPNLLSCTPTLEMGIDIGDLSSLILCSVPPSQASYLQRIGRAGRRDGNALNLTVANGRPHDLYFFAEPEQMLAGGVETPGLFLDASAVLERQFTAFCFDRWVESGIPEAALPPRLESVLSHLEPVDHGRFPHNLLRFIENHQSELFDRFVALFPGAISPESVAELRRFVVGDGGLEGDLSLRIVKRLHDLWKERESLRKKARHLQNRIRQKGKSPVKDKNYEQEMGKLRQEKSALQALVAGINNRETLNFFTDEGLIPNYTFPEAGVVLRSIIYRKRKERQEGGSRYDTWHYDYQRAAAAAIHELAPANHFFAGSRKVQVDQVNLDVSPVETWRFCDDCSHAALVAKETVQATCPHCGSAMWADEGQKREMLRIRQVFATTADRDSRIDDASDMRDVTFYNKQMLVDLDENRVDHAYAIDSDEFPFGFEFLEKAALREVNFGEKGGEGEAVKIAGEERPRKGFEICRHCGKIPHRGRDGAVDPARSHTLTCTARNKGADENLLDCIYLYRELTSPAIRFLLPVTTFAGSERKLHSFVAALNLGLRRHFRGNVDHLQTTVYDEPVPDSPYRKRYLVLYDRIPGGTGYLKQLMRSEKPLMGLFQLTLDTLRTCVCRQDPEKDGCYRCLYAYRSSYNMEETSRETAIELLSEILRYRDRLRETTGLKHLSVGGLFDSELEMRFVEALRRAHSNERPVQLRRELVNGRPGFFLKIGECHYTIEQQVNLGEAEGVTIPSRADFVFRPVRGTAGGRPIVVFTDGYEFHRDRVGDDMAQRMAIARSGRYHVWSLTWRDVENRYHRQKGFFRNYLEGSNSAAGGKLGKMLDGYGLDDFRKAHHEDSFEWLLRFLATPDDAAWRRYAFVQGLMHLDPGKFGTPEAVAEWTALLTESLPEELVEEVRSVEDPSLRGLHGGSEAALRLFVVVEQAAVSGGDVAAMRLACALDDTEERRGTPDFQPAWNGYLRLYNLFQFLPHALFVTRQGVERASYAGLGSTAQPVAAEVVTEAGDGWDAVKVMTGRELHPLLDRLAEAGWPAPEPGFELADETGEIVAQAELAWQEMKVAFLQQGELEHVDAFEAAGWRPLPLAEVVAEPGRYVYLRTA